MVAVTAAQLVAAYLVAAFRRRWWDGAVWGTWSREVPSALLDAYYPVLCMARGDML